MEQNTEPRNNPHLYIQLYLTEEANIYNGLNIKIAYSMNDVEKTGQVHAEK